MANSDTSSERIYSTKFDKLEELSHIQDPISHEAALVWCAVLAIGRVGIYATEKIHIDL